MKATALLVVTNVSIVLLIGCASPPIVLDPIGPPPVKSAMNVQTGWLQVYTATETHEIGGNTVYHPHSAYRVYTPSGRFWAYVQNHRGDTDESAAMIKIPAGEYLILARSEGFGPVRVPVVIEAGKRTSVHLESGWRAPRFASTNQVVRLPNGEAVGWRNVPSNSFSSDLVGPSVPQ